MVNGSFAPELKLTATGYTDEAGNRSFDTVYQNTTGNPLQVTASVQNNFGDGEVRAQMNVGETASLDFSDQVGTSGHFKNLNNIVRFQLDFTVPDGNYYQIEDRTNGNLALGDWREQELVI